MRESRACHTARQLFSATMLVLTPLLLIGGPRAHAGHADGQAETRIFAEASHAGEAHHWEAVRAVRGERCPACLAPGPSVATGPPSITGQARDGAGSPVTSDEAGPPDAGAHRSQRSRAPPSD